MPETTPEPVAPVHHEPPTIQQTVNTGDIPSMGITGFAARIGGISILCIFVALYVYDRHDSRDTFKEMISDLKADRKEDRRDQQEESKNQREQNSRQWEAVKENTNIIKKNTETIKQNTEVVKSLAEEVKKTTAANAEVLQEVKKLKVGMKPDNGGGP